jgi:hypothetical protein
MVEGAAMKRGRPSARRARKVTWDAVREVASALPASEEGTSYGTPAFKVSGKLFVRLHQDGDAIVVRIDTAERTMRMQADPNAFFITDHYAAYPWMLVRLSAVRQDDLADILKESWRLRAPKRILARHDAP